MPQLVCHNADCRRPYEAGHAGVSGRYVVYCSPACRRAARNARARARWVAGVEAAGPESVADPAPAPKPVTPGVRRAGEDRRGRGDATGERLYAEAEWEFLRAVAAYQKATGRKFPAYSELFRVLTDLGYRKESTP